MSPQASAIYPNMKNGGSNNTGAIHPNMINGGSTITDVMSDAGGKRNPRVQFKKTESPRHIDIDSENPHTNSVSNQTNSTMPVPLVKKRNHEAFMKT